MTKFLIRRNILGREGGMTRTSLSPSGGFDEAPVKKDPLPVHFWIILFMVLGALGLAAVALGAG